MTLYHAVQRYPALVLKGPLKPTNNPPIYPVPKP
jgi:hypothetical protein